MMELFKYFLYNELPTRGKQTAEGEPVKNCSCGGRCYIDYAENRIYDVYCEDCGEKGFYHASSIDEAIRMWNIESEVDG